MNARFADYTTSGAFSLSLTRNQVSALAMLEGGDSGYMGTALAALERRGLAEPVANPGDLREADRVEMRATRAGLLVAALVREAGLTNGPPDPQAVELEALRAEVITRRQEAAEARCVARSALARKAEVEWELENERRKAAARRLELRIIPRDPTPDVSDEELRRRAAEPRPRI